MFLRFSEVLGGVVLLFIESDLLSFSGNLSTWWAPSSHKWRDDTYKWPYKWGTGVVSYKPHKWSYNIL